jgi:hypothetical protein
MEVEEFRIACGYFIGDSDLKREELEKAGSALIPEGFPRRVGLRTARARGSSMEPRVKDGWWIVFETDRIGSREGHIVVVEDRSKIGVDRYTLKVYHSEKLHSDEGTEDGTWVHTKIELHPMKGSGHSIIHLDEGGTYRIVGWYIGCVPEIQRVDKYEFPSET